MNLGFVAQHAASQNFPVLCTCQMYFVHTLLLDFPFEVADKLGPALDDFLVFWCCLLVRGPCQCSLHEGQVLA